jgi:hypothetical protein
MIELHLPVVYPTDPLRVALRRMRLMNVSGAVCSEGKEQWLLYVREVVFALHENPEATVGTVTQRIPLNDPSAVRLRGRLRMRTMDAFLERLGADKIWRDTEVRPRLGAIQGYVVEIHSESLERALASSPRDCFCDKSGERVTGYKDGDRCPNEDGGTVRCA